MLGTSNEVCGNVGSDRVWDSSGPANHQELIESSELFSNRAIANAPISIEDFVQSGVPT